MSAGTHKPHLITVMGSGETSPKMAKVHRALFFRFGPDARGVVLDTPVGFQLNAGELGSKAVEYFRVSVDRQLEVATFRDADRSSAIEYETMLAALRDADYVFAGPGSPTYALRQWSRTAVPDILREKLRTGGCVTFASAAALTLGRLTVPVYEIYKVGEEVHWEKGLDLMAEAGLSVAVIPHYNNAEGGTHDTRFSYLGEERLQMLERQMPEDTFVLGVDEHTALVLDLDTGSATVAGAGGVTIRRAGRETRVEDGETVLIEKLRAMGGGEGLEPIAVSGASGAEESEHAEPSFWSEVEARYTRFLQAISSGDAAAAGDALLALDGHLWEWSKETFGTDEMDRARAAFREMLARISQVARHGLRDPRTRVTPIIEALLAARDRSRAEGNYQYADELRDALTAAGIEVRDTPQGTTWGLTED